MLFNFQPFEPYSHASSNRSITKMKPVLQIIFSCINEEVIFIRNWFKMQKKKKEKKGF